MQLIPPSLRAFFSTANDTPPAQNLAKRDAESHRALASMKVPTASAQSAGWLTPYVRRRRLSALLAVDRNNVTSKSRFGRLTAGTVEPSCRVTESESTEARFTAVVGGEGACRLRHVIESAALQQPEPCAGFGEGCTRAGFCAPALASGTNAATTAAAAVMFRQLAPPP